MSNHISHAELPYPIRGARFTLLLPYLAGDGTPTDPTTPDTEISKDNGTYADCAEEVGVATGGNGTGMLTLSGAETDCAAAALAAKAASGPKTTVATLYPRRLVVLSSGTASAGAAGTITLGTILPFDIAGCFVRTTGGTGGGGTGGANNQARKILSYNTSTGVATIAPNWEVTVSSDTTYEILLPEGVTSNMVRGLKFVIESQGSVDAQQALSVILALVAGRTNGGDFSTPNNGATRAAVTYTGNNRTGVILTPSAAP